MDELLLQEKLEAMRNFIEVGAVSRSTVREYIMYGHYYEVVKFVGDSYESAVLTIKDGENYEIDIKY